jgi:hypothetical protein
MRASLSVLLFAVATQAGLTPFFGYYGDNVTETPFVTLHLSQYINNISSAPGVKSLLSTNYAVFLSTPKRMILQPEWQAQLSALAAAAAPFFASGALIGYNLGDELVWNCLAPSNLTLVAEALRLLCPRESCVIWYNEAAIFHKPAFYDKCENNVTDFLIPSALDWFSTDIYHMDGAVSGWVKEWVGGYYDSWIFPNITSIQKVVLVPGSFGSDVNHYPNGTYVCDRDCYDDMISHDAVDYASWGGTDARVAAILPWNWNGCAQCNGSRWSPKGHTCCMDELGTRVMPKAAATWERLFSQSLDSSLDVFEGLSLDPKINAVEDRMATNNLAKSKLSAISSSGRKFYFGFYDDNVTATPYVNIHLSSSLSDARANFAMHPSTTSLLSVYDTIFTFSGVPHTPMLLQPLWREQLAALVAAAAPDFASGAIMGFNLGDELVDKCLAPSNLTLAADAVRALCPIGKCILWYNEAADFGNPGGLFFDGCRNTVVYTIPAALDWFSTDIYHMNGTEDGWVNNNVRSFYEEWIFPNLTASQRAVLVPGSFGSNVNHYPNGTYVCDKNCYDDMVTHDANDYATWAADDTRIAAILPWNWGGCSTCNGSHWTPPHTCCMDELGTVEMPKAAAAWETLFGNTN